jgi:hypothetical protein
LYKLVLNWAGGIDPVGCFDWGRGGINPAGFIDLSGRKALILENDVSGIDIVVLH